MAETETTKPKFVYVTYIKSTRKDVFQALTDGDICEKFWFGHRVEIDRKVGGSIKFYDNGKLVHDDKLLAYDPPSLLAYSWQPLNKGFDDETPSRVTCTLEDAGGYVKLTLVHDDFMPGGKMMDAVSQGWPVVLSGLKTLMETGEAPDGLRPPHK
jgi:uncharacterized protein YndB with AHSA1/START domain